MLLGLNGAGKSTLFSLITRLYATRTGAIRIFGHDVAREAAQALRRLGVVFQARTLDPDLSVMQNLIYHAALHGIGPFEAKRRSADVLARAALADRANEKVRNLSGGQMRRVEIARALSAPSAIAAARRSRLSASTSRRAPTSSRRCAASSRTPVSACSGRRI